MKFYLVICLLAFLVSCDLFQSEYDILMDPVKAMKVDEKKSGKQNPVFDGISEPDFPDQKLNDSTIAGIDSNKDGIRDDVEIWINRTAEDEFVRWSMKDYYKKYYISILSASENMPEPIVHKALADWSDSGYCLNWMQKPYSTAFIKRYRREPSEMTSHKLINLFPNTSLRKNALAVWNGYQIDGVLGGDNENCKKTKISARYLFLINEFQKK